MKRLLVSAVAMFAIHAVGCGGGALEEGEAPAPVPEAGEVTQQGPIGGVRKGTRDSYYSDSSYTTLVGVREYGCPPSTIHVNWGTTSAYKISTPFVCYVDPPLVER
ncbi:hypothetical protein HPC49_29600 [Pyxidicoccus fallax]|uniref:Lipoprotein n=1 Tax=Pyxidicoccus fallax TaxID=394095 RepID=A0A848LWQ9_9BACT|nr:hypothetical protein [Pyxidicoccus fallax]NMO22465.1 hypothetical protein [Pyxidicoccus fallax]NPC82363.1 hypothetical protein [Pyxidicoccus fallax]